MLLVSEALQTGSKDKEEKANAFIRLCDMEWSNEVSTTALSTLRTQKLNKVTIVPLTEDITKMHSFLKKSKAHAQAALQSDTVGAEERAKSWLSLAQLMLAQLILFNRRRVGEVSKMTVDNFRAIANPAESEVSQHLSPLEKQLCRSPSRVEVVGKRGNHVPILFTADFRGAVNLLVSKRKEGNVLESNPHVFAQPKSESHLRGSDVMKKYASECGVQCPQALRGTALRKHVAIISQVLNLRENELDLLAQFMGHNIKVHREFYRLPSDILQTAKVSKILWAMENGQQQLLTGKSLDEITVDVHEGNH